MTLDRCYYEDPLELEGAKIWRTRKTLVSSDHLPLVVDFHFGADRK
jgi:endonuclease/exonuclease/phosphatase family metal-dependent hydrolase